MAGTQQKFDMPHDQDIAWCPGCGNFPLLNVVKSALSELGIEPKDLVLVSGIGQAAKTPQYFNAHMWNGLHGRALPAAMGIKLSNRRLVVIAESGDGDMYGEGGNHFLHAVRRNYDVTMIVHNNMVYGLTKGQASPTSDKGFVTPIQVNGVALEPFNPMAVAIALDAAFVARANIGNILETKEILKQAVSFKGFSIVDIFQPCVVFNKVNTYEWFKEHTYSLEGTHNSSDRNAAFLRATESDRLPVGVFYKHTKPLYEDALGITETPLYEHSFDMPAFQQLLASYR